MGEINQTVAIREERPLLTWAQLERNKEMEVVHSHRAGWESRDRKSLRGTIRSAGFTTPTWQNS